MKIRTRNNGASLAVVVRPTSSVAVVVREPLQVRPQLALREMQATAAHWLTVLWIRYGKLAVTVMALAVIALWRGCSSSVCWGNAVCVVER